MRLQKICQSTMLLRKAPTRERSIEAKAAVQKPEMAKPGTIEAIAMSRSTLTTKLHRPKVKNVKGNVISFSIGLTNVLTTPITMATTKAEVKPEISNPGKI